MSCAPSLLEALSFVGGLILALPLAANPVSATEQVEVAARPITATSSTSQSTWSETPEIFTVAPGSASAREALMKCQALRPWVCGSGSIGRFMRRAISAAWSA